MATHQLIEGPCAGHSDSVCLVPLSPKRALCVSLGFGFCKGHRERQTERESQPTHLCHYQTVSGEGSFVPFSRKVCSIRPFLQGSPDGLQPLSLPNSATTGMSASRATVYTRAYMCFIVLVLERFQHKAVFL